MTSATPTRIIDSHTGGEPTRVVVSGGPLDRLGAGDMATRLQRLRSQHDAWRRALVNEPRGNDVLVGALLCPPDAPEQDWGMIFFNNVGYLGMCGHGTIGVVETLAYLGLLPDAASRPDAQAQTAQADLSLTLLTPVGAVRATRHIDGSVSVANVASYRWRQHVAVRLPGFGPGVLHGDVAWGGNWFFLCHDHGLDLTLAQLSQLEQLSLALRRALREQGITGADGAEIDHIELLGAAHHANHHGRGFVMCPGGAYDRSPCGTGTSAKLACLAADGQLAPQQLWRQESVTNSVFEAHYVPLESGAEKQAKLPSGINGVAIMPTIRGRAHITLDATLVFDPNDALTWGFVR